MISWDYDRDHPDQLCALTIKVTPRPENEIEEIAKLTQGILVERQKQIDEFGACTLSKVWDKFKP